MFFNRVILVGRLVANPDIRYTAAGVPVAKFRLAVDRPAPAGALPEERKADFIDVVTWRQSAEFAGKFLEKGRLIIVEGRLQTREFTDREGMRRRAVEVLAQTVRPLQPKREVVATAETAAAGAPQPSPAPLEEEALELPELEEEIDFELNE